jgi:anti-sigma factor RsiW
MNCKNFPNDLIFYLDRELPEERMEAVRKHLDECVDCQSFLAVMQSQLEIIDQEKQPEVSPYFFTRLSARLDEKNVATR